MFVRALTKTGKWLLYLLAGLLILIAMLATFARLAVFYGEDYSEQLASVVSRYIGSPVQIRDIDLVWNRFDASASLSDVRILSEDSAETLLVLPSIELELNLRDMLLQRNLSVRKVQLKNLSLVAAYEGHGELKIHGYEISRKNESENQPLEVDEKTTLNDSQSLGPEAIESPADEVSGRGHSALSWLFNAERIAILDSDITLTDSTREKTYRVDNVDIRAFNSGDLHQIRINSALPGAMGETSVAAFDFTGQADNVNDWTGQFYINARQLNLAGVSDIWREQLQTYSGRTDMQLWGRWRGTRVNQLRAVINGVDLELGLPVVNSSEVATLAADNINIDLDWTRTAEGWESTFTRFTIDAAGTTAGDGQQLNLDGLSVFSQRDAAGTREVRVAGPDVPVEHLQPLLKFANAVAPSGLPLHSLAAGTISNWLVATQKRNSIWQLSAVRADLDQLDVLPIQDDMPGVSGLTASVFYRDGAGSAVIKPQQLNISLPKLYEKPLPPLSAQGTLEFARVDDSFVVATEGLKVGSIDIATDNSFRLQLKQNGQRLIDAVTSISHVNLAKAKDYYPTKVIKPKFLKWLNSAIVNGDVVRGQVSMAGDLADFSPADGRGVLFGEADIVDSTLKFRPDWPAATEMDGNITFDGKAMRGRVYQGAIREARFSDARLYIADFKSPVLELQTNAIGPLNDMLDFVQRGPLAKKIGSFFGDATGSGASRMALDLSIPLKREQLKLLRIDGSMHIENAQINAARFGLDFESVTGKINFNRQGVSFDSLLVRYLGIPLEVNAVQKVKGDKTVNTITVDGPVAVSSVLQSYGVPMTDAFQGISDWRVELLVTRSAPGRKATVELTASSDLSGTAVALPVPLDKPSDTLMAAQVYRNFSEKDSDWWIDIPGLAQTRIRIGKDKKLESMAVALGSSNNTVLPWRGLAVHGDVTRIDTLGWLDFAFAARDSSNSKSTEPFPLFAKVSARSLLVGGQDTGNGVYIAYRDGTHQVHRIESAYANGELLLRKDASSDEPLVLRLDNLDKKLLEVLSTANSSDSKVTGRSFDPRTIPPLDVIVKELKWDNWRFSRVALRTEPEDRGMGITGLTARQKSMRVSGNGRWEIYDASGSASHATTLDLNVTFDNVGQSIKAVGGGESFADGQGEVALSLGWPGAAYKPDLKEMTGQLFFSLRNGRILGVEPGAGRILGLFALQALPRRLTLDFRDIVRTGLEYSTINGNFAIANGRASTQTLLLTGPVAEILVHGDSDFVNRTYDQTVDVLPRVSGALPLIGVLSGGPAAGVTALVADGILKGLGVNLDEIGRRRYLLRGPWDTPSWETVNLQSTQ